MPPQRLSALDASFLAVESPSAHMHVGWAATFEPPEDGPRPELRRRCSRTSPAASAARPRYRQRIAPDALGLNAPLWIDAEDFDPAEHIHRSAAERPRRPRRRGAVRAAAPRPPAVGVLDRRPSCDDGRIGLVGKAHHCMVDGLAAVELGSLLLDTEPDARRRRGRAPSGCPPRPRTRSSCWPAAPGTARASSSGLLRHPLALARAPLALPAFGAAHRPRAGRRACCRSRRRSALNEPELAGPPPRDRAAPARRAARDQARPTA